MSKILLVDDDTTILRTFERILSRKGHSVDATAHASDAIDLVAAGEYDVILSDIAMPGMDGLSFVRNVRERDIDVPVVLMTGDPSVETAVAAIDEHAFSYLTKPIAPAKLDATIARAAKEHELARLRRDVDAAHAATARQSLEVRFDRAVEKLWMAFQPIVSWTDRKTYGYEALARCEEATLANPALLFDAAERLGRVQEVGRRARALVAEQAIVLPREISVFVNLHPSDLLDAALYDPAAPLSQMASRVVLEITERASLDDIEELGSRVAILRSMGFRIAVDDLGAGYAGLSTLTRLEPDIVKLDMSLVRDIDKSTTKHRVVRSMISLGTEMRVPMVMEGVETAAEREVLAGLGAQLFQGYLFARPGRGFPSPSV